MQIANFSIMAEQRWVKLACSRPSRQLYYNITAPFFNPNPLSRNWGTFSKWGGGIAPPDFVRSDNPIGYAHHIKTCPSRCSEFPMALSYEWWKKKTDPMLSCILYIGTNMSVGVSYYRLIIFRMVPFVYTFIRLQWNSTWQCKLWMRLCSFIHTHLLCNMKMNLLLKDWVLDGNTFITGTFHGKNILDVTADVKVRKIILTLHNK